MRIIPSTVQRVIDQYIQTEENRSKMTSIIEIKRPETVLRNDYFLEDIGFNLEGSIITDVDICVGHRYLNQPNDDVYIAGIVNGNACVYYSKTHYLMEQHKFVDTGIKVPATSISICFDSKLTRTNRGQYEKITEATPYSFYVNPNGALICMDIDTKEETTLTTENVGKVSAVSGVWHESTKFDYGTMVFYTLNHKIWVRRLIKGVWYNPELVTMIPNETYNNVTATLTWDYRVAVTCTSTTGQHILFSNFLGFGKFSSEKVRTSVTQIPSMTETTKVYPGKTVERIRKTKYTVVPRLVRYSYAQPISVTNVKHPDNAYGHRLELLMDTNILNVNASTAFELVDSSGKSQKSISAWVIAPNKIGIDFKWFHDFVGTCRLIYHKAPNNSITNEYNKVCPDSFELSFVPINLSGLADPATWDKTNSLKIKSTTQTPRLISVERVKLNNDVENIRNVNYTHVPIPRHISDI